MCRWFHLRWSTKDGKADQLAAAGGGTIFRARLGFDQTPARGGEGEGNDGQNDARAGAGVGGDAGVDSDGAVFVVAVASVDQAWGARRVKGSPDIGPQVRWPTFMCVC